MKILDVKCHNWGLIGPGSWKERKWSIYDDMSVCYTILYNSNGNDIKTLNFELSKDEFDSIIKNIELAKKENIIIDAFDGVAWGFIKYNNDNEIWKRDMGYIYGISSLENITTILTKERIEIK